MKPNSDKSLSGEGTPTHGHFSLLSERPTLSCNKMGKESQVVLTRPLSLDGDSCEDFKAPNLLQRVLSLLKNVRPGSDLTHFQLPPLFNLPKSHIQCFGENVYCVGKDMLGRCSNGENSLERFTSVVAWSISTTRPLTFGIAPYNSILGETHHVSYGSLNVLLEQVSHHPPVSALHATDEQANIEMIWCHHPIPRFYGTKVEVELEGKRQLKLLTHGETYLMNMPNMFIRLLPPSVDWVGNIRISCQESGLEADLHFSTSSFLGRRGKHSVKGKIYQSSSLDTLLEIDGHWNSTVTVKDVRSGKQTILYDAKDVIGMLKAPVVKDPQKISQSESAAVWSEVSRGILSKEWDKAREAKRAVEERQRELAKKRSYHGEIWTPKYFNVSHNREEGWNCTPKLDRVPPAPIVVPL